MKAIIRVIGCDDETEIEVSGLSEQEVLFLEDISERVTEASRYQCMPIMEVRRLNEDK